MLLGEKLSKTYPSGKVLDNVTIQIAPGQIYGLLGRNGAGKSTLFKILCGLIKPDTGKVSMHVARAKPIGAIIEKPGLYPYLSAADNLRIFAGIQGLPKDKANIVQHLIKVGLPVDRNDPVRNFSMGMKQRLGIAIALLNNPEYLVLDEPFNGLDPIGVASLIQLIQQLAFTDHIGILLSSHLMVELTKCCHFLYVIDEGKMVNAGFTNQLIQDHIQRFSIAADNITTARAIRNYQPVMGMNDVKITCPASQIANVLQALITEGIRVTACTPELTLEQLIKQPTI
ncbi:ABC transporter ATP-binding protein [Olivibacter ginsenosidimutans]|uniref:ABC transporter ATP-binding protein n=1 Tax=Olivibacter ginsenosidimutans TaxID=1176537 RepID=A0ABP9CEX6_9SPHI